MTLFVSFDKCILYHFVAIRQRKVRKMSLDRDKSIASHTREDATRRESDATASYNKLKKRFIVDDPAYISVQTRRVSSREGQR